MNNRFTVPSFLIDLLLQLRYWYLINSTNYSMFKYINVSRIKYFFNFTRVIPV